MVEETNENVDATLLSATTINNVYAALFLAAAISNIAVAFTEASQPSAFVRDVPQPIILPHLELMAFF